MTTDQPERTKGTPMNEISQYDQIDRLVDEDTIALRDLAWQLLRERDEARAEVARLSTRKALAELGQLVRTHRDERDEALGLLDQLTDDDPCDYDHHDYCQTHHLLSRPCANARAIARIAAVDQMAKSAAERAADRAGLPATG